MTAAICEVARAAAPPGTIIEGVTPERGPASVEGHFEALLSAASILELFASREISCDAVVIAGFGDLGREGLQELLTVPVIDITEAAVMLAALLGPTYSIVTMQPRSVPLIRARLAESGLDRRCASIRATGSAVLDLDGPARLRVAEELVREACRAVEEDGAEVIVLGCAGMAGLRDQVAGGTGVPVVDGVEAGVQLAYSLVSLGLVTSKRRTLAPPKPGSIARARADTRAGLRVEDDLGSGRQPPVGSGAEQANGRWS